jgi:dipeptidase E
VPVGPGSVRVVTLDTGTFLTLGGGGFSTPEVAGDRGSLIDDFLLSLTGKDHPKVCFIGTSSGDATSYVEKLQTAFTRRAQTTVLALFNNSPEHSIPLTYLDRIRDQDVVYVGGG